MNLVVPILAVFLVSVGVVFADTDNLDDLLEDDSSLQLVSLYTNFPATQLFVELDTRDEYNEHNDVFLFDVAVTNVGTRTAYGTTVKLQNIPIEWNVWPRSEQKWIYRIEPNETKHVIFAVERNNESSEVYATAKARNSQEATSNVIPIPVFWTTIALTTLSIVGLSLYRRR